MFIEGLRLRLLLLLLVLLLGKDLEKKRRCESPWDVSFRIVRASIGSRVQISL